MQKQHPGQELVVTGVKSSYPCPEKCEDGRSFASANTLKRHMEKKHGVVVEPKQIQPEKAFWVCTNASCYKAYYGARAKYKLKDHEEKAPGSCQRSQRKMNKDFAFLGVGSLILVKKIVSDAVDTAEAKATQAILNTTFLKPQWTVHELYDTQTQLKDWKPDLFVTWFDVRWRHTKGGGVPLWVIREFGSWGPSLPNLGEFEVQFLNPFDPDVWVSVEVPAAGVGEGRSKFPELVKYAKYLPPHYDDDGALYIGRHTVLQKLSKVHEKSPCDKSCKTCYDPQRRGRKRKTPPPVVSRDGAERQLLGLQRYFQQQMLAPDAGPYGPYH